MYIDYESCMRQMYKAIYLNVKKSECVNVKFRKYTSLMWSSACTCVIIKINVAIVTFFLSRKLINLIILTNKCNKYELMTIIYMMD